MTLERVEDRLNRLAHHFPMLSWEEAHYKRAWTLARMLQYDLKWEPSNPFGEVTRRGSV